MTVIKNPIKAIAILIDIKDFPQNCSVCVFCAKSQCIPQGERSTVSYSVRPKGCPLMTIEAFKVMIK